MPNVLFVCSKNQWRSPTAEKIFSNLPNINVASAGLSPKSKRKLSTKNLLWADVVYVMEEKHKKRILEMFRELESLPPIYSLDIPDLYEYMDPELVVLLEEQVYPLLKKLQDEES